MAFHEEPESKKAEYRKILQERRNTFGHEFRGTFDGPATFIYGEFLLSDRRARLSVIAHEHYHAIQTLGVVGSDGIRNIGPEWLAEGSARCVERRTLEHAELPLLQYSKAEEMTQARKITESLQSLETAEAFFALSDDNLSYTLGALAADLLADNYGGLSALTRYYRSIEPGTTWEEAFDNTFGISIEDFYQEFGDYRAENFPPE